MAGEINLDDYQAEVVERIIERVEQGIQVTTLGGLGGTGKTVIIAELARRLPDYAVVAPTNKAVQVLKRKGIDRAQTVHSLIRMPKEELGNDYEVQEIARKLSHSPPLPMTQREKDLCVPMFKVKGTDDEVEGIICDEASMIDKRMFLDMLSQDIPLVFVGDHGQLPPVSIDPYDPAFSLMKEPQILLEKVYRNAGDIARFAAHIRAGGLPHQFQVNDGSVVIGNVSEIGLNAQSQVMAWTNAKVFEINRAFRSALRMTGDICEWDRIVFEYSTEKGALKILKGMTGTVRHITDHGNEFGNPKVLIDVDIDDDKTEEIELRIDINFLTKPKATPQPRWIKQTYGNGSYDINDDDAGYGEFIAFGKKRNPAFAIPVRHAYAMTVHKSQGSEWPSVVVLQDMPTGFKDFRAWGYTAASRAKTKLYWLFER
jgi:exodeoxyribonuclease V